MRHLAAWLAFHCRDVQAQTHLEQGSKEGLCAAPEMVLPGSDICLMVEGLGAVIPFLQILGLRYHEPYRIKSQTSSNGDGCVLMGEMSNMQNMQIQRL